MEAVLEREIVRISPQPGPQNTFLSTDADIAIYGGAAGAGKTFAILMEAARYAATVTDFAAVIFRRTTPQIKKPGGLWDESMTMYPPLGGIPTSHVCEWHWEGKGKIQMSHLEHEKTKNEWQGSQIPLIIFDELTHFTESQFFYMLSRSRSMCGVRPYIRATCNPDADSWVARILEWWIDQKTGFPIPERSGVIRWFIRVNNSLVWADSKEELLAEYGNPNLAEDDPEQIRPKSLTFIPGKLSDNQALMKGNPDYLSNLKALPTVEQARLLGGNWKIRAAAGLLFKRHWCEIVDAVPADCQTVRYWDLAATEKTNDNDPDWTVGIRMSRSRSTGLFYVEHAVRMQKSPHHVNEAIKNTASADGRAVRIGLPQDPGQAGKSQAQSFVSNLPVYNVQTKRESGDKVVRFGPFSAQCQAGNVKFVRGFWNEAVFETLEAFPSEAHDDDADACSGAYDMLVNSTDGLIDYMRAEAQKAQAAVNAPAQSGMLSMIGN